MLLWTEGGGRASAELLKTLGGSVPLLLASVFLPVKWVQPPGLLQVPLGQTFPCPDPLYWLGGQMGGSGAFWGGCSSPQLPSLCPHREEVLPKLHSDADYPCDLVGNWNTWYGEQDQAGEGRLAVAPGASAAGGAESKGEDPWLCQGLAVTQGERGVSCWVVFWGAVPLPQPHAVLPVHLWRFSGGYPALMDCMNKLKQNKVPPGSGRAARALPLASA